MPDSGKATLDSPLFAPALSLLFTLALSVLVRDVSGIPGPGPTASIMIVASSFISRWVGIRVAGNRSGMIAQARAFVLTILVSYAVLSLARPVPFADRLIPDLLTVWRLILVAGSWTLTAHFLTPVHERCSILRAVYAEREGEKRQQVLRDMSEITAAAMQRLKTTRRLSVFLFVLLVALALAGWAGGSPPSPLAFLLVALYAIAGYLTAATLDTFFDEYRYIGDGNRLPTRYRRRRMHHAATLLLAAAILALPLTSRTSMLPPELLGQFASFLGGLWPTMDGNYGPPEPPDLGPGSGFSDSFPEDIGVRPENSGSSQWVQWVFNVLQRLVITAIVAGLAVFLFAPLWTKEMRRALREKRWKEAAVAWLSALRYRLGRLLKAISLSAKTLFGQRALGGRRARHARLNTPDTEAERTYTVPPRDAATKKRLERASKRFQRLERWAWKSLRITRWSHEAPAEFTGRIADTHPDIAGELRVFAARYERALFGATGLSREAWDEMESALRTIVRTRSDSDFE